ncbi:hypothetical protein GCL60_03475 [Silvanigrella paludirubra]|uniref:PilZ domain-containing protein n=1 Tax=Silvanigrella paludirubra TaxID=2499159 RepID=A0A6N6VYT6_9BACT|nr:hypothetical protein [Silvanigrella paludirubra]KAB8041007.1 hypothetical protein GCL60_03475 [Silvanigrella paludirubra]
MHPKIPKRREPRYETAIVAEVFTNRWNPLISKRVVVLDLSWKGFKLEFIAKDKLNIKTGKSLSLRLPIDQFNISNVKYLKIDIVVKWCDKELKRIGGVLIHPKGEKAIILGNLIQKLALLKQTEDDLTEGSQKQLDRDNEEAS